MKRFLVAFLLVSGFIQGADPEIYGYFQGENKDTPPQKPAAQAEPQVLQIGIVASLVQDLSAVNQELIDSRLPSFVQDFTALKSQVIKGSNSFEAGKKLAERSWHLGFFPGVEFAWAQAKDPKLQPLLIAFGRQRSIQAFVMAKKESPLTGFMDLKGKEVYVQGKLHCRLFAEKRAQGDLKSFFGKVANSANVETALDDVLLGNVQAAVVDNNSLKLYQDIHPGRFDGLKTLDRSEVFPPKVIGYYPGALSNGVLDQFRAGTVKANASEKGRQAMADVGITAFEPVPADFPKQLSEILKAYPAPGK